MSRSCGLLLILWIIKKCTPLCRRLICAFDLTELSLLWDGRRFNLYCVRVAFAFLVFCGSRCCYYRWIYYRSLFYDQSFCCELLYHLWKKLFLQLVFWDGSLFYSAFVCRLLIITIFLPSLQYLFSVFCRRKSGHLPELPWEEFFIIVTAAYCCRINAHGGRIQ